MRNRGLIAAIAAIAGLGMLALASAPAGAERDRCGSGSHLADGSGGVGTGGGHRRACSTAGFVNPFKHRHWWPGRTDMGVDYGPTGKRGPVVAIGDAKIIGSDSKSGWPGGHFIWYRLLDGSHKGNI